ncbi:MAG: methionyl-tRNA formyltransferase [Cyanobacteriota bacterium]|nr:methionyl-tRNA formyltransferase [Cyanobacteriota bacterium]
MNITFWGTPNYAVPSLDALHEAGHRLVAVVSQPDRRRGRGAQPTPSPVAARALALGLPLIQPERIRRQPELQQQIAGLGAEAHVVVAFGQILPPEVLAQPPLGCWNGHGSLLPRWRGAAPIQWSVISGDSQTGVGIMAMEEGLDTGPVLLERSVPIGLLDDADRLAQRLSGLTAELLVEALPRIAAAGPGPLVERLQRLGVRHQGAEGMTMARLLQKDDYRIDWSQTALAIHRRVMGLYPGAFSQLNGRRLKILTSEPLVLRLADRLTDTARGLIGSLEDRQPAAAAGPGVVLQRVEGVGLVVATGGCPLLVRRAQLEGRAPLEGGALLQQLGIEAGDQLG